MLFEKLRLVPEEISTPEALQGSVQKNLEQVLNDKTPALFEPENLDLYTKMHARIKRYEPRLTQFTLEIYQHDETQVAKVSCVAEYRSLRTEFETKIKIC